MRNGDTPITIIGNLVDDPELRFTPAGAPVAKFRVAVNRRTFDRVANEWKEDGASFHRCTVWRHLAEHCAESLQRGMRVVATGVVFERHWTDTKTNEKRSGWEFTVDAIGPELTFATAHVTRVQKNQGDPNDPWATATPGTGVSSTPSGYSDEPPF